MAHTKRVRWAREEAIAALSLYCRIPFGQMHSRNPVVRSLAAQLGRTPGSVALKLVNFASLDPEHKARGIHGMGNTSSLDKAIWVEFFGNWHTLAEYDIAGDVEQPKEPSASESVATVRVRRGQQYFRRMVLAAYSQRCCVTGIATPELLRASHIIPWAANKTTRLDPHNGLALNSLHDAAFDRGLIAFDDDGTMLISRRLAKETPSREYRDFFDRYRSVRIHLPERFKPDAEMLAFHRKNVFAA